MYRVIPLRRSGPRSCVMPLACPSIRAEIRSITARDWTRTYMTGITELSRLRFSRTGFRSSCGKRLRTPKPSRRSIRVYSRAQKILQIYSGYLENRSRGSFATCPLSSMTCKVSFSNMHKEILKNTLAAFWIMLAAVPLRACFLSFVCAYCTECLKWGWACFPARRSDCPPSVAALAAQNLRTLYFYTRAQLLGVLVLVGCCSSLHYKFGFSV